MNRQAGESAVAPPFKLNVRPVKLALDVPNGMSDSF